jgi:hypothetical protein
MLTLELFGTDDIYCCSNSRSFWNTSVEQQLACTTPRSSQPVLALNLVAVNTNV